MAVNLLLSYAFHADTDLAGVRRDLVCGRLMIDSGAFTAWSKGRPVKLADYASFLQRWSGCWDHAVSLDVIGDPAATAANTRRLHEQGLPVMPVFTRGNTLADFDAMVADVGYVCVGGLVGMPAPAARSRARMLQRRAAEAGGGIHALGMGSMASLRTARPYSADASSVSGAFRFGTVVYYDGREMRNVSITDRKRLTADRDHLTVHGIELASLARTGRMPNVQAGRGRLMRAMSLAYAVADEHLKRTAPVAPPRLADTAGPHVYSSVIGHRNGDAEAVAELDRSLHPGPQLYNAVIGQWNSGDVEAAAGLDRALHPGPQLYNSITPEFGLGPAAGLDAALHAEAGSELPPIWRRYARHHQCRRREPAHAPS